MSDVEITPQVELDPADVAAQESGHVSAPTAEPRLPPGVLPPRKMLQLPSLDAKKQFVRQQQRKMLEQLMQQEQVEMAERAARAGQRIKEILDQEHCSMRTRPTLVNIGSGAFTLSSEWEIVAHPADEDADTPT